MFSGSWSDAFCLEKRRRSCDSDLYQDGPELIWIHGPHFLPPSGSLDLLTPLDTDITFWWTLVDTHFINTLLLRSCRVLHVPSTACPSVLGGRKTEDPSSVVLREVSSSSLFLRCFLDWAEGLRAEDLTSETMCS